MNTQIISNFTANILKNRSLVIKIVLVLLFIILSSMFLMNLFIGKINTNHRIVSDLPLPHKDILLERHDTISKMDKILKNSSDINIVALTGAGGAGKTTTARQYARINKSQVIWEINAETKYSLVNSLKELAYALYQNKQEKKELRAIQAINNEPERERRLLQFITSRLKKKSNWLIIYNNVDTFQTIKNYFPYDPEVWGVGNVIITTRDSNIAYSSYIPHGNVIKIGELHDEEKLFLYNTITLGKDSNLTENNQNIENIESFLSKIPPYPLDLSLAANYIKEERISCNEYLKYISNTNPEAQKVQAAILNDIGDYTKTRYDIVTFSIKHIIEQVPSAADMLLFISMIDSQDIPKNLLISFKDEISVSKLIHELRKYSLISEDKGINQEYNFSIHRSTQNIIKSYLSLNSNTVKNPEIINKMSSALEIFMEFEMQKQILPKKHAIFSHSDVFLSHANLIDPISLAGLSWKLGNYYFNVTNYLKAESLFTDTLKVFREYYGSDSVEVAKILGRLGNVSRNQGDYKKAVELLTEAHSIYKEQHGVDYIETILISSYLGGVYRNLGDYQKSVTLLQKAFEVFKEHYGSHHIRTVATSIHLGNVYKNLGQYKKAKTLIEQAVLVYEEYYGKEHVKTAWAIARLGSVYRNLGDLVYAKELIERSLNIYRKLTGNNSRETAWTLSKLGSIENALGNYKTALELIEKALTIYNSYFTDDHIIKSWSTLKLANVYYNLSEYQKSIKLIENSLTVYGNYYGDNHTKTAGVLKDLGMVYLSINNLDLAENYTGQALRILTDTKHPNYLQCLEALAEIYTIKSKYTQDKIQKQNYKEEAKSYLDQALEFKSE